MGKHLSEINYNNVKKDVKAKKLSTSAIAEKHRVNHSTVKAVRHSKDWTDYRAQRAAQAKKIKVVTPAMPDVAATPREETLTKPDRRSKQECKEVLKLRTEIEVLKTQLANTEKSRDRYQLDSKRHQSEAIRLGRLLDEAKRPLWKKLATRRTK